MKKHNLILITSVTAIVLSIAAICTSLEAFSLSNTAYLGIIIAVLSMLVVVLIGWNIYTIIDVKDEIKNFDGKFANLTSSVNYSLNRSKADLYGSLSEFYRKDNRAVYEYFYYSLLAVLCYKEIGENAICNSLIRVLIESFPVIGTLTTTQKAFLLHVAAGIKEKRGSELSEFDMLHALVIQMKVSEK
jgi:hypothetical protein